MLPPDDRRDAIGHRLDGDERRPLVRKMESLVELSEDEREACRTLPMSVRDYEAEQDLAREGDRPSQSCLILEGMTFRYKICADASRQILALHIQGEIPDLHSLFVQTMDHSLAALTPARVGFIQHRALHELMERHPRLARAFWRETLIDAAIFREWIVGLGQRRAPARIAHLFCEMYLRLKSIGLAEGWTVGLPLTQSQLGDALGLSAVHVNRALQELRGLGLITFERRKLTINSWTELAQFGDFDPTYLHLQPAAL